jgi:ubiquinone/menaquinone biosynthesis C-methylase UbiE
MKKDFRKRVYKYYNAFAPTYDFGEFFRRGTRAAVVEASGCQEGDKALEICSGTCELALAFARQGIHTVAVDLARKMLLLGRNKSPYPHLEFLETDALSLPFVDKSFDAVVISLALHHMPEGIQVQVLSEMARLARKRVVTLEWHTPDTSFRQVAKGLLIRVMDISEHLGPWMRQDFPATCHCAGLVVERQLVLTAGFHRLTVCSPIQGKSGA